jgi:hypothetical protein
MKAPVVFNRDDWGLAGEELREVTPVPAEVEMKAR